MFKKLFAFTMIACMFMVQAHAAAQNGLKAAFDELNYALTIEWDQKDQSFYNTQMEKFASELKVLQSQGLSNQELMDFTVAQIKDEKLARDIRTAFSMILINKMSQQEAQAYVKDVMSKSYNQGASWSGGAVAGVIAAIVFIAVAAVIVGAAKWDDGCYQVERCEDYCFGGVCNRECDFECI